ncbi:carbohydrate ABC transporter permease [Paenibacillus sp. JX-17]|uniref:Carbohydrate ABC transporter permease n=1 Tax=Paenibacillus lacisoli TaxID=3064525 RepID=A0ABT9CE44_9BACL|nr:carbohydrate ABC transporter permease [Paenibacillus sp. JX-17]MDO7907548.1 carbohydrate ABC transporter permease [Paenibacillus sp. JX-17]
MVGKKRNWAVTIPLVILFLLFAVFSLFPLFALILASLKPSTELLRFGLNLRLDWDLMSLKNYSFIFQGASDYFLWYRNSIVFTVLFTVLCLLLSAMVGYGLAMYQFRLKNTIFLLVLIVMMIPVEIIMLPLYKLMIGLKLINTVWGVILPFVVAPIPIFFFRQYLGGVPKDFMDAARVDGCSEYGIFVRVMMPLMAPAFAAMAILQAMNSWNNFLWPMIVLRTNDMLTLPIGLSSLLTPYGNNYDILIAGSVLAILPILIVFLFFQRYFIEGMTAGGVKG